MCLYGDKPLSPNQHSCVGIHGDLGLWVGGIVVKCLRSDYIVYDLKWGKKPISSGV